MALSISLGNTIDLGNLGIVDYPFSMALWYRSNTNEGLSAPCFFTNAAQDEYHMILCGENGSVMVASRCQDIQANAISENFLQQGRWHHLVGVFNAPDSRRLYIDGDLWASDTTTCACGELTDYYLGYAISTSSMDVSELVGLASTLPEDHILQLSKGVPLLSLPKADQVLCYHDLLRSVNRPGIGPEASYTSTPTVVSHPRVMLPRGGVSLVRRNPISGPFFNTTAGCHTPGADPAGLFVPGIATDSLFSYAEAIG